MAVDRAQSIDVKRAEVEFHNFASLGEPERASRVYRQENERRGDVLRSLSGFIGPMTPFLEIGANAGHTSLLLMNDFGADGFALDISADSLRHGYALMEEWDLPRGPVRLAGDALHLPFRDGSLRCVLAFQMLSQFMDIEQVFLEVKRVLMPGGVFVFAEEPMRRILTLRLWRCPYEEQMTPWERRLWRWGLLPFLVRDVVGAGQEESFGIRQNHTMNLADWHALVRKHFAAHEYRMFVPERGPWERAAKRTAVRLDLHRSDWRAARLLGGTLAAACRKAGVATDILASASPIETLLCCPDDGVDLRLEDGGTLRCQRCGYVSELTHGVYNLIPSKERDELYPGDRDDIIDFSRPGHETHLVEGWHELEGVHGNLYRWIGASASARLRNVRGGPQRLRVRGFRLESEKPSKITLTANGERLGEWTLDRPGLFVIETPLVAAPEYDLQIDAFPVQSRPGDRRPLTVNLSLIRLLPLA